MPVNKTPLPGIAVRLTRWYAGSFLGVLAAAFLALYGAMATVLERRMEEDLREDAAEFALFYRQGGLAKVKAEIANEMATESAELVSFQIWSQTGELIHSSDLRHWQGLGWNAAIAQQVNQLQQVNQRQQVNQHQQAVLQTLTLPDQDYPSKIVLAPLAADLLIQIGESTEEQQELLELLIAAFVALLVLALPLALGIGWWVARKAARGIETISRAAAQINRGQLDQRVHVIAQDAEVRLLADSFNAMLDRVRDLVTEMREMTDNIAHDMRSPLARIRAVSESALSAPDSSEEQQNAAVTIIHECDRLLQMINASLDVAEAGTGNGPQTAIDLSRLTADACELFEAVAEDKGVQFVYQLAANCRITGHESHLQRMLANLIDNAIRYTTAPGRVSIVLAQQSGRHLITVADTGIGIPERDLPRVFDRFFRCDHSRSSEGFGLGLSFARQVARAHGGDITVISQPSHGSTFTISLPTPI